MKEASTPSSDSQTHRSCCQGGIVAKIFGASCVLLLLAGIVSSNRNSEGESPTESTKATTSSAPAAASLSSSEVLPHDESAVEGNSSDAPSSDAEHPPDPSKTQPSQTEDESDDDERDARYRQLLVGTWEDDYQGKRVMEIREDGTATMDVYLEGWRAMLSADHLKFEMNWSVENGRLKKQTIGGEPKGKVNLILKTMGDRVDEPILELTNERLRLLDADGKTKYDWRRAMPNEQGATK